MSYLNKLNIPLGNWFGVGVALHWTFTLVMGLVFILNPHYALLVLGVFFIVLLHEGGHVVAGRHVGIEAKFIWLTPIGGMAMFDSISPDPKKEFVMTVGGPLVNVALILPLYVLSAGIPFMGQLAYYNMVILIFNLIPAFPSDGGRILRSALTYYMGDYLKATEIACRLSQGVCIAFGIFGFMTMNFSLALIAMFLFMCAEAERQQAPQVLQKHTQADDILQESADLLSGMQKKTTKFRKRHRD